MVVFQSSQEKGEQQKRERRNVRKVWLIRRRQGHGARRTESFKKEESYPWTQVPQGSKGQGLKLIPQSWQLVVDLGKRRLRRVPGAGAQMQWIVE